MSDIRKARQAIVTRVLEGEGTTSHAQRRSAYANEGLNPPVSILVEKVAMHATDVTDEDIAAARIAGLSDDQIFELVICAALGQATRQNDAALAALRAAAEST